MHDMEGRDLSKTANAGNEGFEQVVDIRLSVSAAKGEADGGLGFGLGEAHCGQDVRGFDCAGRACGAAGNGKSGEVESDEQRFPFNAGELDVGGVGSAWSARAVDASAGDAGKDGGFKGIA
jgi:hypothetical protein